MPIDLEDETFREHMREGGVDPDHIYVRILASPPTTMFDLPSGSTPESDKKLDIDTQLVHALIWMAQRPLPAGAIAIVINWMSRAFSNPAEALARVLSEPRDNQSLVELRSILDRHRQ